MDTKTTWNYSAFLSHSSSLYESGDQLELVAKLKGKDKRKKRQEEVKALLADLGIEAYSTSIESDVRWTKATGTAIARAFIGIHRSS